MAPDFFRRFLLGLSYRLDAFDKKVQGAINRFSPAKTLTLADCVAGNWQNVRPVFVLSTGRCGTDPGGCIGHQRRDRRFLGLARFEHADGSHDRQNAASARSNGAFVESQRLTGLVQQEWYAFFRDSFS